MRVTSIPNQILQMAYNKLHIPLTMLTVPALNRTRCNMNLHYRKIPFGVGASVA
jgi:hypothetical protein